VLRVRIVVAGVEGPAHLTGDDVEAAQDAARHVGLHVVRHAAAHHHGGAGEGRRGGELVFRIVGDAEARLQVDEAALAEAFAHGAGVGVDGDQAGVDGIHQQAAPAVGAGRQRGRRDRGRAGESRLGQRLGDVEIGQAAAAVPDLGLRVDVALPDLLAAVRVDRDDVVMRRA
jgi:hypothetical protein